MEVIKVVPQGYCGGVKRAIDIVKQVIDKYQNDSVYLLGMPIHNKHVLNRILESGVKVILDEDKMSALKNIEPTTVIIPAHGTSKEVYKYLTDNNFNIVDATCPLVKKVHELVKLKAKDKDILYIGNPNHPEAQGVLSLVKNITVIKQKSDFDKLDKTKNYHLTNQTTLSILDIKDYIDYAKETIPNLEVENSICNSTYERQKALLDLENDLFIIVGDKLSSNTNKLKEIAQKRNPHALVIQVEDKDDLVNYDLSNYQKAYVTSGASTPQEITENVISYLLSL